MGRRVLVCEDEEPIRDALAIHLGDAGYDVVTASDGAEALAALSEHAPIDGLLLDLKLPRVDGLDVLRQIRDREDTLAIVVMTAFASIDSAIEATKLGAASYVQKPCDLVEVEEHLARAFAALPDDAARGAPPQRSPRSSGARSLLSSSASFAADAEALHAKSAGKNGHPRSADVDEGDDVPGYGALLGRSPAMTRVFELLGRLENVKAPTVLIGGETGVGKDLVARSLHARGPRRDRPYIAIDCTSIPEHLVESELFGHERGSFTDARTQKRGLFELAKGGTIFLDEIGELPAGAQAKLLRALENRTFRRVGGVADLPLEAAIVAASNRDLRGEVNEGRFREDLFFRLNVVPIVLPPLRERAGDIELLAAALARRIAKDLRRPIAGVDPAAVQLLERHAWPGNVRELKNVLERAIILKRDDGLIVPDDLPAELRNPAERPQRRASDHTPPGGSTSFQPHAHTNGSSSPSMSSMSSASSVSSVSSSPISAALKVGARRLFELPAEGVDLAAVERDLLAQALDRTGGNKTKAAQLLGITRFALRYRLGKHGVLDDE